MITEPANRGMKIAIAGFTNPVYWRGEACRRSPGLPSAGATDLRFLFAGSIDRKRTGLMEFVVVPLPKSDPQGSADFGNGIIAGHMFLRDREGSLHPG
ncbi:hypothetical protein BRAS3843_1940011 [Bradyrhizobium sp. STM 3843]|nr:hypothetical protein BRAS3843_1940011 [Bradyrhizobium sp. STM 3843]